MTEQQGRVPDEVLDRLVELDEAATDGPWARYATPPFEIYQAVEYADGDLGDYVASVVRRECDAKLIAEMRNHIAALVAEVRGHRAREVVEYGVGRPSDAAYMDGETRYAQIVSATFRSREQAETARHNVPALRDREAVVLVRRAPSEWEVVDGE